MNPILRNLLHIRLDDVAMYLKHIRERVETGSVMYSYLRQTSTLDVLTKAFNSNMFLNQTRGSVYYQLLSN